MILRERQRTFVERSVAALRERGNTLGIAPTGAGKSVMLASVVGKLAERDGARACVLAHRDEITAQNMDKFRRVNPEMAVSVVDSRGKSWSGNAVFAMAQTLVRERNLEQLPPLDLLVIDEAHHARAESYLRIIEAAKRRNPELMVYGVTATPNRGDGKSLRDIFDNCADQITLSELIASGQLVRPRTFVIDIGVQDGLKHVRRLADDYDMAEVEAIMDHTPLTEAVVRHWREKAGDRRTVVFCSTVAHATHVAGAFVAAGVKAEFITGETSDNDRAQIFHRLDTGETQVLVNVAVATEGWDCPPVSCVVLLRPCSHKSVMIQMIGRGLRKLEPDRYPGLVKTDCVVLDFGTSAIMHGSLEQAVDLETAEHLKNHEAPIKTCPGCKAEVPAASRECPFCGYEFMAKDETKPELGDFAMAELDLLKRSPFKWCNIKDDGAAVIATGFEAWGGIFRQGERWCALGGMNKSPAKLLCVGERTACLASADDWLRLNETENTAHKSRRWLHQPPTEKQISHLPQDCKTFPQTRYEAACLLSHKFNRQSIQQVLRRVS
ncbi:MAG: DEAD/DEAH box helicase [Elusimicrobiales bacterium]